MIQLFDKQEWFYPPDFMQGGELFVGYGASARFSELAKAYPEMFESRKKIDNLKYLERRFRFENLQRVFDTVPAYVSSFILDQLARNGLTPAQVQEPRQPRQASLLG